MGPGGLGEVQAGRLRAWHCIILPPLTPFLFLEDNLSHRSLANYRSGEQLFTQDVRPEQLLEGKVWRGRTPSRGWAVGQDGGWDGPQYGLKFLLRPGLRGFWGRWLGCGHGPSSADSALLTSPPLPHATGCSGHS